MEDDEEGAKAEYEKASRINDEHPVWVETVWTTRFRFSVVAILSRGLLPPN